MTAKLFTLEDLKRTLTEAAGVAEGVDLDADILDTEFEVIGYESLALLEAGSLIEREYGISLDEEAVGEANTPRAFIDVVNAQLAPAQAA
ncbi:MULTISPECIES: acyl carrier protein [Streptomyces]|jgi:act minimal PKS acyl carrier protein|uniref:Acyl carrier protein n=1 Tax=Streptomyces caniscabiei TaxID=2746961 RepID=A0A927QKK3_9ACTN|nr:MULTISPECIES: acyl carrier protein [Streptomyces]MBD9729345.1 acyl carrier protein [Streptomyces caniscabiei]MBE4741633.1 acyl carrier protein [Streptomyces caniscabiei]MBE4761945.1 acyl carrier protein [Streptomyces caniscabiei]MBE4775281.1 acyl carrier protein [Streptomyces caniscabiei]MBE4790409.1 acyl carrier protein [Streptomyces caniscabiei]